MSTKWMKAYMFVIAGLLFGCADTGSESSPTQGPAGGKADDVSFESCDEVDADYVGCLEVDGAAQCEAALPDDADICCSEGEEGYALCELYDEGPTFESCDEVDANFQSCVAMFDLPTCESELPVGADVCCSEGEEGYALCELYDEGPAFESCDEVDANFQSCVAMFDLPTCESELPVGADICCSEGEEGYALCELYDEGPTFESCDEVDANFQSCVAMFDLPTCESELPVGAEICCSEGEEGYALCELYE